MMKTLLVYTLLILAAVSIRVEAQSFSWARSINGDIRNEKIRADSSGYVMIAGQYTGPLTIGEQQFTTLEANGFYFAKFTSTGTLLWMKMTGVTEVFYSIGLTIDASGNVYAIGEFYDGLTIGSTRINGYGNADVFLAKFDMLGKCQWAVPTGGKSSDQGLGVAADDRGNSYITGVFEDTATFGNGKSLVSGAYEDMFVAKYDPQGTCVWAVRGGSYGPSSMSRGQGVTVDASGNVYVTGFVIGVAYFGNSKLDAGNQEAVLTAKIDSAGRPLWAKQTAPKSFAIVSGNCVTADPTGNSIVVGDVRASDPTFDQFQLPHSDSYRAFLAKYDREGTCLWATANSGKGYADGNRVIVEPDGNYYLAGTYWGGVITFGTVSTDISADNSQVYIGKFDPTVKCLWITTSRTAGWQSRGYGMDVTTDGNGGVYAAGEFENGCVFGGTQLNGRGVFIAQLTENISAIDTPVNSLTGTPAEFALKQNYPNPFNPSTTIAFSLSSASFVTLKIFDVMGREVSTVVSQEMSAGSYSRQWNASGLPNGVYCYRLQAGTYSESKLMLLVK